MKDTENEGSFEQIHKSVKDLLVELNDLVSFNDGSDDPKELLKHNEAFLRLLDQMNAINPPRT